MSGNGFQLGSVGLPGSRLAVGRIGFVGHRALLLKQSGPAGQERRSCATRIASPRLDEPGPGHSIGVTRTHARA